jgi:hypothetical protein
VVNCSLPSLAFWFWMSLVRRSNSL